MHFYKALEGWDPHWDPSAPHSAWATRQGIEVLEGSFIRGRERANLKRVLYISLARSS